MFDVVIMRTGAVLVCQSSQLLLVIKFLPSHKSPELGSLRGLLNFVGDTYIKIK